MGVTHVDPDTSVPQKIGTVNQAARTELYDAAGNPYGTEANPLYTLPAMAPVPANGGFYTCAGRSGTAAIAASLAIDTTLMGMRLVSSSSRTAYLHKFDVHICIITVGTSALVPGTLGLQRFTGGNPSGGTSRTPSELDEGASDTSDMTVIQDLNSALTMTAVAFGAEVDWFSVPIVITGSNSHHEWHFKPMEPLKLVPGDGLCLRTRVAMPGTQTWMFTWNAQWEEK